MMQKFPEQAALGITTTKLKGQNKEANYQRKKGSEAGNAVGYYGWI